MNDEMMSRRVKFVLERRFEDQCRYPDMPYMSDYYCTRTLASTQTMFVLGLLDMDQFERATDVALALKEASRGHL